MFVLDQFEEVFTLVAEVEAQQRLFDELGNLVQGRIPAEVAARLDAHDELLDRIDPERLGARFVLSLREDYLPDLEIHADRIPRLGPNRYRLLPMSQAEALEAIDRTGGALVETADAERIVRFLDQQNLSVDPNRPRPQRRERIEPALLSLVCAGLNQHRVEQRAPKLDARSLDRLGGQLLEKFYDDALAALPEKRREAAARFIETELITLDGKWVLWGWITVAIMGALGIGLIGMWWLWRELKATQATWIDLNQQQQMQCKEWVQETQKQIDFLRLICRSSSKGKSQENSRAFRSKLPASEKIL